MNSADQRAHSLTDKVAIDNETDIGNAVVALAGPDLDYLTGAALMLDGGLHILAG